jgi:Na+-transporting NADH:ubiquinone oxidoreductase subunit NqrC|tara:strand:+ start:99 stop:488 length:390 start_codon:yes stop_codon:yes gene_type:complete
MLKIYLLIIVLGLVGGSVYGGYYYYKDTQARIQILTENSAKLEAAKMAQDNTIKTLKDDASKYRELNNDLSLQLQKAHDYKNKLIGKLRKHDLTRLSQQKPNLVEKKINRGTKRLFESFESDTALPVVK